METELKLVAVAAIIGFSSSPTKRYKLRDYLHSQRVLNEREEQVLADVLHCAFAEAASAGNRPQMAFDKRHSGTLHLNVGPGAPSQYERQLPREPGRDLRAPIRAEGYNAFVAREQFSLPKLCQMSG